MIRRILSSFEIPFNPRDEKSNREHIIGSLINIGILNLSLYLIPAFIQRGFALSHLYIVVLVILLLVVSRLFLLKRLGTEVVSFALVILSWIFVNGIYLFFENGLRAPGYMAGTVFLIVYVGLLHGKRSAIAISIMSVLTGIIFAILESRGIFFTKPKIPDTLWVIAAQIILFPTTAFMVTRTLYNFKLSILSYQAEAEKRQQSELHVLKLNRDLEQAYESTLEGWARALELKDKETLGHSQRVTALTIKMAKKINFSESELRYAYYGALLHDIGKMGVPDEILKKSGKLTPEDREIINQHTVYAYNLLKDIEYLQPAIAIPYSHHEQWDGKGYPQGLKGEEIPLPARIFAIADNWDALTSTRPYHDAWPTETVIGYLLEERGKKFDPYLVDIFINEILPTEKI